MSKENQSHSSSSAAWAWATLGIVFIVFYFGTARRREADRESSEERRPKRTANNDRVIVDTDRRSSRVRVEDEAGNVAVEVEAPPSGAELAQMQKFQSQAFSDSMRWLNRSMDSLGEKLKRISDKIENTEDKALVEEEIKKAFRDAFVHDTSHKESPHDDEIDADFADIPADHQATSPQAEVGVNVTDFSSIADAAIPELDAIPEPSNTVGPKAIVGPVVVQVDRPILGEGVPEWIRQIVIENDRLLVPIESSMHASLQECREELKAKLPLEVRQILDMHVLKNASADSIAELNDQYIRDKLVDRTLEFDNYQERPSGNFHQLWVRMDVEKKELEQIKDWEREIVTQDRVWELGGLSAFAIGSIAGLSGIVSLLSRREQKKNQQRRAA